MKSTENELKKIVITGATSGIGLNTVLELSNKYHFIVGARNLDKAKKVFKGVANVTYYYLDLSVVESVYEFANILKKENSEVAMLINNGGVFHTPYTLAYDNLELQFASNYISHFLLTNLLIDIISEKIITVSSIAHKASSARIHYDDINFSKHYSKWESYQQSKLACMLFGLKLDRYLKSKNSSVISIVTHPGVSLTNIVRTYPKIVKFGLFLAEAIGYVQSSQKGSKATNYAITADDLRGGEYIGPYRHNQRSGPVKILEPSKQAQSIEEQDKLWKYSEDLLEIEFK